MRLIAIAVGAAFLLMLIVLSHHDSAQAGHVIRCDYPNTDQDGIFTDDSGGAIACTSGQGVPGGTIPDDDPEHPADDVQGGEETVPDLSPDSDETFSDCAGIPSNLPILCRPTTDPVVGDPDDESDEDSDGGGASSDCGDTPSELPILCDPVTGPAAGDGGDGKIFCERTRTRTSPASCEEANRISQSGAAQGVCAASNLPGVDVTDQDTNNNQQDACDCEDAVLAAGNCDIVAALQAGLNILTGVAGLAIVGGIMFGGYLYMSARDNPGQIAAARSKILWAFIALFILLFFWAFLQWLIPGGLL